MHATIKKNCIRNRAVIPLFSQNSRCLILIWTYLSFITLTKQKIFEINFQQTYLALWEMQWCEKLYKYWRFREVKPYELLITFGNTKHSVVQRYLDKHVGKFYRFSWYPCITYKKQFSLKSELGFKWDTLYFSLNK